MTAEVVDLDRGETTVASLISRLSRYQDAIKHLTVVVTWKGGDSTLCDGDAKGLSHWAWHAKALSVRVSDLMRDNTEPTETNQLAPPEGLDE